MVNHSYDCAILLPPILAADFDFSYLYRLLLNREFFGGLLHEDPNLHIKNFLRVCALHKQYNVSDDALRLRLFPFSLQGKARTWLDDLPPRSIHNWDELLETFLDEFFPAGRIAELRSRILTFKQKPHEALHEAWVRYRKCLRKCPQHGCTDESLLERFYFTLDPNNQLLADDVAKGSILKLTFPDASKVLDKVAKQAHAWDDKWRDVPYESSNSTISQDNEARDETMAQLSAQITLLTKQITEMMAEKESSSGHSYNASGQLPEQNNHVHDQEEDANYMSSYQGGPNQQRINYQGGQDHNQWKPLQQWNSNQGWNNQQNNPGWSSNNQGHRGAGSSQAYTAPKAPMYQQGNQSPPYHSQSQQFSLSKDNYEQAKETTDFWVLPKINLLGRIFRKSGCRKELCKKFYSDHMNIHILLHINIFMLFDKASWNTSLTAQFPLMPLHAFLNFDDASKGNPGLAGAGAVLRAADERVVFRLREGLGIATNNVAEYRGVILGLKYALEKGFKHIQVQGDSKLVCMQTLGIWKTKQNMVELSETVKELKDQFMSFRISHVERELNTEGDAQANPAVYLNNGETQVECDIK